MHPTDDAQAVELAPHRHEYHGDLCAVLGQRKVQDGDDRKELLEKALVQCEIAAAIAPADTLNHSNLGPVRTARVGCGGLQRMCTRGLAHSSGFC